MKKFTLLLFFACTTINFVHTEEVAVCPRCQLIREENAKKGPPKHVYYEDYLKEEGEGCTENPEIPLSIL